MMASSDQSMRGECAEWRAAASGFSVCQTKPSSVPACALLRTFGRPPLLAASRFSRYPALGRQVVVPNITLTQVIAERGDMQRSTLPGGGLPSADSICDWSYRSLSCFRHNSTMVIHFSVVHRPFTVYTTSFISAEFGCKKYRCRIFCGRSIQPFRMGIYRGTAWPWTRSISGKGTEPASSRWRASITV
jgi:hypothetical protein